MEDGNIEHEAWPARAAMLALLGAILGIAMHLLVEGTNGTDDPVRISLASFVAVGGITFAFTLERLRWFWSMWFGLGCGLVVALVFYSNGSPTGWSAGDEWRVFAALLAAAIAAPLFQSVRDAGRWSLRAPEIHAHAWTNLVLWGAAWAFVGASFLLTILLAELFNLIGIDLLREALREGMIIWIIIGGALGAAIGLLRDRDKILGLLQRVATTVLSVLAPVLAVGLVLFVLALPFTGLQPLWDKTSATTPVLLLAVAGSFFLANAIIGNSREEEAKARVLRLSAMALGAVMLPLAAVAAFSTWLRIDQHGFTPERLWALIFVLVVLAVAATYLWALVRGRAEWAQRVRPANVRLALGICALALLLATPLINFGAISTRDQLARLETGRVKPEEFDWSAMRFDFGPSGRRALERLSRSGSPAVRQLARKALRSKEPGGLAEEVRMAQRATTLRQSVRVLPRGGQLPADLTDRLADYNHCAGTGPCIVFYEPDAQSAVVVSAPSCEVMGLEAQPTFEACEPSVMELRRYAEGWGPTDPASLAPPDRRRRAREQMEALQRGQIEVRAVERRQVFIGGKPVGNSFE